MSLFFIEENVCFVLSTDKCQNILKYSLMVRWQVFNKKSTNINKKCTWT